METYLLPGPPWGLRSASPRGRTPRRMGGVSAMKPRKLHKKTVCRVVPAASVGMYKLGTMMNGRFVERYFGRSDTDLRRRLQTHAITAQDTHFVFRLATSPYAAFRMECAYWHLDLPFARNRIHPAAPAGTWYQCPFCHFGADEMVAKLARRLRLGA